MGRFAQRKRIAEQEVLLLPPGWFTDAVIVKISKKIGREYRLLAAHLDIEEHELDQFSHRRFSIQDISQDFLRVFDISFIVPMKLEDC